MGPKGVAGDHTFRDLVMGFRGLPRWRRVEWCRVHPRLPSYLARIRNAASDQARRLKRWTLKRYWEEDSARDWCNRALMGIASDLTTVSCLDPETASSVSNRDLLIERGVAVMPHYRWIDSNYDFLYSQEPKDEVDEYVVFWTVKDYFPTLATETERLLKSGEKAAMETERHRRPYNPFSDRACREIDKACRERDARSLTLYGSYADGTQRLNSKIDFLAEMNPRLHPKRQTRTMVELQFDLERILGGQAHVSWPLRIWDRYEKDSIQNCSVLLYSQEDPTFRSR